MDYVVSFRTLCKADVRKTVVASLKGAFMDTVCVRGILATVVTHGIHFMSGMQNAAMLIRDFGVIFR